MTFTGVLATFILLLIYPFLGMLWRHSYPVLTIEVVIYLAAAVVLSMVLTFLVTKVRALVGLGLIYVSMSLVILVHFNFTQLNALIALIICAVVIGLARNNTPRLFIPVLLALIVGVYLDSRVDQRMNNDIRSEVIGNQQLPPVIHLVMDSFGGPDGLPNAEGSKLTSSRMHELFESSGFKLFPKAYSRFSATVDSLSNAFNFRAVEHSLYTYNVVTGADHHFEENQYFNQLAQLGYRISIYQNEDMDFCQASNEALDSCWTYLLPDLDSVRQGVDSMLLRTYLLFSTMLRQSSLIAGLAGTLGLVDLWGVSVYEPGIFTKMLEDIERRPRGVVYFAHILFPHSPFVYTSECELDYEHESWERFSRLDSELFVTAPVRDRRYLLYNRQARCALKALEDFFTSLQSRGLYDDSIIIVHGDHGSLISQVPARGFLKEELKVADYLDVFSILFAIKSPTVTPGEIDRPVSLENLMTKTVTIIRNPALDENETDELLDDEGTDVDSHPYVYLLGTVPMEKVEVNLFRAR